METKQQPVLYKPYNERIPDDQYRNLILTVLNQGIPKHVIHGEEALTYNGYNLRFPMENGFPVISERKITQKMFSGGIGEHIGFLHGARTLDELISYGMAPIFWEDTVTEKKCADFGLEKGDLGPGSYGEAWKNFPMPDGTGFDQITNQLWLMKNYPHLRTFMITPWIPYWTNRPNRKVVVAPCHGWLFITLFPEHKMLNVHHVQRSADILVGLPINFIHYATFGMMLSRELGYRFNELIYTISDAHIYKSQIPFAEALLQKTRLEGTPFPTVTFTENAPADFFDIRPEHFILSDYHSQFEKYERIPTLL